MREIHNTLNELTNSHKQSVLYVTAHFNYQTQYTVRAKLNFVVAIFNSRGKMPQTKNFVLTNCLNMCKESNYHLKLIQFYAYRLHPKVVKQLCGLILDSTKQSSTFRFIGLIYRSEHNSFKFLLISLKLSTSEWAFLIYCPKGLLVASPALKVGLGADIYQSHLSYLEINILNFLSFGFL